MPKKEHSIELTKMINRLQDNKVASASEIKKLIPEKRIVYLAATEKFVNEKKKLIEKLVNRGLNI